MQTDQLAKTAMKATKGCSVFLIFFCVPWALVLIAALTVSVILGLDPMIIEVESKIVVGLVGISILGAILLLLGTLRFGAPSQPRTAPISAPMNANEQNAMKV